MYELVRVAPIRLLPSSSGLPARRLRCDDGRHEDLHALWPSSIPTPRVAAIAAGRSSKGIDRSSSRDAWPDSGFGSSPTRRGAWYRLRALRAFRASRFVLAVGVTLLTSAVGCGTELLKPDFEARNQLGSTILELYKRPDGFWWQDADIWDSQEKKGIITTNGSQVTGEGGMCGPAGSCTATYSSSVVTVRLLDIPNSVTIEYHLRRNNGALEVSDTQDNPLVALKPRSPGADIFDGLGNLIGTADPGQEGTLWVSSWDQATIGSSNGDVPPEIAALAQGAMLDTATKPRIPGHAIVIAAALTWLP
jgi:hypothetical protein